ncbi:ice-binding protein [Gymnopus androsaceus JB14]|uniref:Ice-binding protein n=1 Tax=Gymnopus androsaceus JB14 TaxID=1447944 RepID=A0A6A4ILU4_9AGAR|nr:ice-binding protein [Gymnopus androsaceus JB14]
MLSTVNKIVCLSLWASFLSVGAAPGAINLGPAPIALGTAANFAILSETGVSTVPPSSITGNIGVSPISANALTGFSLTLASTGVFSTSNQVIGELFAATYAVPTPSTLTTAISNMQTAYTNANGLVNPGFINLAAGSIGGLVLTPALYKWTSAVGISSAGVTISGTSADVFVFQIAGTLTIAANARVTLVGGALASNIFWVVAGVVTVEAGAHIEGVILAKTAVTLETEATMNGRILAQTFVALQKATVVG